MKPTTMLAVLGTTLALLPAPASAQLGEFFGDFDRSGLYVGVGGLYTQNSFIEDQLSEVFPIGIGVDDSWGVNAQLGYRAFSFLAAEVEYEYVDGYDVSAAGVPFATLQAHLLTGNLKWIMPFWRIQPYLLGGVGFVNWNVDDQLGLGLRVGETNLALRAGAGVDFHLTSRLALNAGVDGVFSNTSLSSSIPGSQSIDFLGYLSVGAGLQYRFWGLSGR